MYIKTAFFLIICLFLPSRLLAQTTASFDNISVPAAGFLNDAAASGGVFQSGNVALHNYYDASFLFWDGWAISKITDNTTPGYNNQYSAIPGKGYNNSANYAVGYSFSGNFIRLDGVAKGGIVNGLYVTNSTYAYFSMLDGDPFAKKFGGVTGNDPDFLKLTIKKHLNGQVGADSVDFYLADYRFSNNSSDYIVNTWQYVDLKALGNADSLAFFLSSSDNGTFGMNTPAYFCVDQITTADMISGTNTPSPLPAFSAYPNPATAQLTIDAATAGRAIVTDIMGRVVADLLVEQGQNTLVCAHWPVGLYYLRVGNDVVRVVKQ